MKNQNQNLGCSNNSLQATLFDLPKIDFPAYNKIAERVKEFSFFIPKAKSNFRLQNRRFLGNKYKLLNFIEDIVNEKCGKFNSFCDIFSGTGVVGERFNRKNIKIISNDLLLSNYISLSTFLLSKELDYKKLEEKIAYLNNIEVKYDNYFSENYGSTYFTLENARKIGAIREEIEVISESVEEKNALVTSLIYATDKIANTVGHYDAYRKKLDSISPVKLLMPEVNLKNNSNNEVFNEDANKLIRKIECDVLYLDPPYNSRQYCDSYHLVENLVIWGKPAVFGKAGKMDRSSLKSDYCLKSAPQAFDDLIQNAKCKHILVSYNNTGESKDGRSNARISDKDMVATLKRRGSVEIFERDYKAFTTGKSDSSGNVERIFYCKVDK